VENDCGVEAQPIRSSLPQEFDKPYDPQMNAYMPSVLEPGTDSISRVDTKQIETSQIPEPGEHFDLDIYAKPKEFSTTPKCVPTSGIRVEDRLTDATESLNTSKYCALNINAQPTGISTESVAGAMSVFRMEDNPTDATADCVPTTEMVSQLSIVITTIAAIGKKL